MTKSTITAWLTLWLTAGGLAWGSIIQSNLVDNTSQTAFTPSATDLINGDQPSMASNAPTANQLYGNPAALTNGSIGAPSILGNDGVGNDLAWTNTFYLNTSVNTNGYTITNLSSYAAWGGGRISQSFELKLAFQGDPSPGTFYSYGSFSFICGAPANGSSKIMLTGSGGFIAENVSAIRYEFAGFAYGTIYREIDAFGEASTNTAHGPPTYTVYVATNGSHTPPYNSWATAATNIHSAIDLYPNALVLVSNGTYNITNQIALNDETTLRSMNGFSNTVFRRASGTIKLFNLTAAATIDGFTLREANASAIGMSAGFIKNCLFIANAGGTYGAINMTGGTVSNCIFTGNSAVYDGGGIHMAAPGGLITTCVFTNNSVGRWGGGVEFENTVAGATMRNCLIARNSAAQGGGGLSVYNGQATIQNCTIVSNSASSPYAGGGVLQQVSGPLSLTNTIIWGNTAVLNPDLSGTMSAGYSCAPDWTLLSGAGVMNSSDDPLFVDWAGGNFHLQMVSPCIDTATNLVAVTADLDGNPRPFDGDYNGLAVPDMGAYEMSVESPFLCNFSSPDRVGTNSLQSVFTATISGPVADTNITWYGWDFNNDGTTDLSGANLRVVTNLYTEPGRYSILLTVSNSLGASTNRTQNNYILVYSGSGIAYVTTNGLSEWPYATWAKAATNIQWAIDVNPGIEVVVSNGTYNLTSELIANTRMTLRSVNGAAVTTIRRSAGTARILNISTYAGSQVSNVVVDGFTIRDGNQYGINMLAAGGIIRNCIFIGNSGGLYGAIHMSGGLVSNCLFTGNSATADGGGIHMMTPGGQVVNCIITNNSAGRWGGGIEFENCVAGTYARNCLIARNTSVGQGGGVSFFNAQSYIENCTVVSNSAGNGDAGYPPLGGGGIRVHVGSPKMTNSIVYFNNAPTGTNISGSLAAYYSCSPDLTNGVNFNITADPKFRAPVVGDYHLPRSSPCINAGANSEWMAHALDLDGNPRKAEGAVDMGAYELVIGPSMLIQLL